MNVYTFSGNLGKDCVVRNTGQSEVANFSVAVKSGYGDREQTLWIDCSLWGKRAQSLAEYLTKGQQVVVSGELSTREHEGKTYLQVRVNDVTLVGKRDSQQQSAPDNQPTPDDMGDDIPF